MPIRFSTEAANADVMGEEYPNPGLPDAPQAAAPDETGAHERQAKGEPKSKTVPARPGKDINAAGFIKDRDSSGS